MARVEAMVRRGGKGGARGKNKAEGTGRESAAAFSRLMD